MLIVDLLILKIGGLGSECMSTPGPVFTKDSLSWSSSWGILYLAGIGLVRIRNLDVKIMFNKPERSWVNQLSSERSSITSTFWTALVVPPLYELLSVHKASYMSHITSCSGLFRVFLPPSTPCVFPSSYSLSVSTVYPAGILFLCFTRCKFWSFLLPYKLPTLLVSPEPHPRDLRDCL